MGFYLLYDNLALFMIDRRDLFIYREYVLGLQSKDRCEKDLLVT